MLNCKYLFLFQPNAATQRRKLPRNDPGHQLNKRKQTRKSNVGDPEMHLDVSNHAYLGRWLDEWNDHTRTGRWVRARSPKYHRCLVCTDRTMYIS